MLPFLNARAALGGGDAAPPTLNFQLCVGWDILQCGKLRAR